MIDIVERLRICAAYDPDQKEAADEIERLRETNKRLAEIATDMVGWIPPASVNGPREEYQNEIKELTE